MEGILSAYDPRAGIESHTAIVFLVIETLSGFITVILLPSLRKAFAISKQSDWEF